MSSITKMVTCPLGNRTLAAILGFLGIVLVVVANNVNQLSNYLSGAQKVILAVSIPAIVCLVVAVACFGAAAYVLVSDSY